MSFSMVIHIAPTISTLYFPPGLIRVFNQFIYLFDYLTTYLFVQTVNTAHSYMIANSDKYSPESFCGQLVSREFLNRKCFRSYIKNTVNCVVLNMTELFLY